MSAPIQLIGAKRRSQQSLQCLAEASPKPINYWTFGTGEMIVANDKFIVQVNYHVMEDKEILKPASSFCLKWMVGIIFQASI